MAYPTTEKEYVEKLKLAASQKTKYWNRYPYNLGYYHADGAFSFDCVNLNKSILNGWEPVKKAGYFVNNLSRTGDCDEWGFISQCDYSSDFSRMSGLAALYMDGHIGNYIGEDIAINGKVYNCIECTGAWGGGVLYSYVDSAGRRFNHKGGAQNGAWTLWGKMTKWLKSEAKPKKAATVKCRVYDLAKKKWAPRQKSKTFVALGTKGHPIGGFAFKINYGAFKYAAKDKDGWLSPVSKYDYKDLEAGMAGNLKPICCVAIWSSDYKLAYRVRLLDTQEWLPWVYSTDYDLSDEDRGYAGISGRSVDSLEIKIIS